MAIIKVKSLLSSLQIPDHCWSKVPVEPDIPVPYNNDLCWYFTYMITRPHEDIMKEFYYLYFTNKKMHSEILSNLLRVTQSVRIKVKNQI